MHKMLALVLAGFLVVALGADTAPPREVASSAQKCDEAVKAAQEVCRKAIVAAKTQYLADVKVQLAIAVKAGKVESIKALDALKSELESEIKTLSVQGVIVRVDAKSFVKVMPVKKGQVYHFEARGMWNMGPESKSRCDADGVDKAAGKPGNFGALMAKVGALEVVVGKSANVTMPADGVLELGPGDSGVWDNSGYLDVKIDPAQ